MVLLKLTWGNQPYDPQRLFRENQQHFTAHEFSPREGWTFKSLLFPLHRWQPLRFLRETPLPIRKGRSCGSWNYVQHPSRKLFRRKKVHRLFWSSPPVSKSSQNYIHCSRWWLRTIWLIFSEDQLQVVAENTSKNAQRPSHIQEKSRDLGGLLARTWAETTMGKLYAYLAILIYMSINKQNQVETIGVHFRTYQAILWSTSRWVSINLSSCSGTFMFSILRKCHVLWMLTDQRWSCWWCACGYDKCYEGCCV